MEIGATRLYGVALLRAGPLHIPRYLCRVLVDQEADAQLAMLASCEVPPAGSNAVIAFLACWTAHAADTHGAYPQRLCALALAKLIASKHPSLSQIQVPLRIAMIQTALLPAPSQGLCV